MPKKIILQVNSKCNAKCRHCYVTDLGERSPEEAIKLAALFAGQADEVIIAGTEILLKPEYLKAHASIKSKAVQSNGILIVQKPELLDEMKKQGIEELHLSMHFDAQKKLNAIPDSLVEKAMAAAIAKGFNIQLNTVITKDNYLRIGEMCGKAHELGAYAIRFIRYVKAGKAASLTSPLSVSEEERQEFFRRIDDARKAFAKDTLEIKVHGNWNPRQGTRGEALAKENKYCPAGKELFIIAPNNEVFGCPFLLNYPIGKFENNEIKIGKELCNGKRDKCIIDYLL